jgi:hypothetical protein
VTAYLNNLYLCCYEGNGVRKGGKEMMIGWTNKWDGKGIRERGMKEIMVQKFM